MKLYHQLEEEILEKAKRIAELKGQLDLNVDYSKQVAKREARIAELEGDLLEARTALIREGMERDNALAALAKLGTGGGE